MNTKLQLLRCVIMGDSCCFFGHRDAAESIRAKLKEEIIRLIEEHDVNDYYIGNQGGFDSLVLSVMKELTVSYPQIRYTIVLAYLPDEKSVISETNTIYPEGLESVPKRFCIARRNDWLIEHSRYVICYVAHITGGAAQFMKKAQRKKRTVINIA